MDSETNKNKQKKVVEKLNKTTKRIQIARQNQKIAQKEAAEFEEIHKLLKSFDDSEPDKPEPEPPSKKNISSDYSVLPAAAPEVKIFHEELIFSLFKENDCCLKNFIKSKEKCLIFGKNDEIPSEECFRKLIAYHATETLLPEEGSCSSISLYVLYLMSVHQDPQFVSDCFDFLNYQKFHLQPDDVFPIFINFGAKRGDLFDFRENIIEEKFCHSGNVGDLSQTFDFPYFNVEKVGRILLQYITKDLFVINSSIKSFVQGLVKITLDTKIRSGFLLPLYSTILTVLCAKIQKDYTLEEILSWVYLKEEHLLNQLEICRSISKSIFPELHEGLVLKILSQILKSDISPGRSSRKINNLKSVLKKLRSRELSALELYSLLQLINSSLPGITATVKDSIEINTLLASLEQKISKIEDSVDLIKIKLEIAKVGNQVTNSINNRFTVHERMKKSSVKKV